MPIPIKYTTTNVSSSVRLGNIALGVNAVDYGPSTTTGFTNGVSPLNGGYVIYYLSGTSIRMRTAADDSTLITVASQITGTTYGSKAAALSGLAVGGNTTIYTNPPNLVTSGSVFYLNAGLVMSYPQTNTTWYDISGNAYNSTLINGPTFDSTSNSISLDGIDDVVRVTGTQTNLQNIGTGDFTMCLLVKIDSTQTGAEPKILFNNKNAPAAAAGFGMDYFYGGGNNGKLLWSTADGSSAVEIFSQNSFTSILGNWAYIVMIRQNGATNNGHFYVNGIYQSLASSATVLNVNTSTNMTLGNTADSYGGYFTKGNFASGQIYNRALTQAEIQQNYYQGNIVTSSLAVALDAGNLVSYPGSGTTWYDLSGNGKHFTLVNGVTWNSAGYFTLDGIDDYISGPAGNSFGLGQEHTIEIVINNTLASTTTLFNWRSSQTDRAIMSHTPYSDGVVYYDVGGCCGVTNRVSYTPSPSLTNRLTYMIYRCRTSQTPYRQVFENTVEKVNSGANATATITLSSNIALIGAFNEANLAGSGGVWKGNLYSFRMYNRALTDAEVQQNYNAMKNRYNL